jgi:hypothetical protein
MTKQHADPKKFVQFWKFWFWQYTSRNPDYIKAFDKHTNPRIPGCIIEAASNHFDYQFSEKTMKILWNAMEGVVGSVQEFKDLLNIENLWSAQCQINKFAAKTKRSRDKRRIRFEAQFLCSPKNPEEDNDSAKILQDALNGNLNKDIPNFSIKTFEEDIVDTFEPTQFTYFVDTEKRPLEQVLAEIAYWYRVHEYPVSTDERSKAFAQLVAGFIDDLYLGFKVDYTDRAIGLWLWDQKKDKELSGNKNYTVSKAIRDLYEIHDLENKGYGSIANLPNSNQNPKSTIKKLTRYFNAAQKSINNREVLPLLYSK